MKCKAIKIRSDANEDWNGDWWKDETEREMRELGQKPVGNDWLYWVTGHVFDCKDFDAETERLVCEDSRIMKLVLNMSGETVSIVKIY